MNSIDICQGCSFSKPSSFIDLITCLNESFLSVLRADVDGGITPDLQMKKVISHLVMSIFGGPGVVSESTFILLCQRLASVWNLGNLNIDCATHPVAPIYAQLGKGVFCLRRYMIEETINFMKTLWEESGKNEEQFEATLMERWPVHWGALTI